MVGTSGPNGTVSWGADPSQPGGFTQTTTLSPGQQALYNSSLATQTGAVNTANQQLGRVNDALGSTIQAPSLQNNVSSQGALSPGQGVQTSIANAGPIATGFNPGTQIQNGVQQQTSYNPGGAIQTAMGPTDFNQSTQDASNAVYNQATSRLDPAFALQQQQLSASLANQGIGINSAAYQNAMDQFGRTKNDAYNQANYSSIAAGQNEQNTLFNQALSQGNFANSAQNQQNSQNAAQAAFGNTANLNAGNFANTAQAQQYGQNLGQATFQNTAQAQQYGQNANDAQFANTAQAQQFGQQGQQFNQDLQAAQFGNTAQQQNFQNQNYAQNQPINQLSALLGLGQVQTPQGISYTPTSVAGTDVIGANALSQQQANANYQAQMTQSNGLMGGLFSLGTAAIGLSDRRLKRDVKRLGTRPDGLGTYLFRYLWSDIWHIGVMAQEALWVKPEAVKRIGKFLAVDYGVLG